MVINPMTLDFHAGGRDFAEGLVGGLRFSLSTSRLGHNSSASDSKNISNQNSKTSTKFCTTTIIGFLSFMN